MGKMRHGRRFGGGGIERKPWAVSANPSTTNDRPWILVHISEDGVRRVIASFPSLDEAKARRQQRGWQTHVVERGSTEVSLASAALDRIAESRPLRPPGR